MIALIITVCLSGSPDVCKEINLAVPEGLSCAINGEEIASDWLSEHPKWEQKPGWRCRYGVPERKA